MSDFRVINVTLRSKNDGSISWLCFTLLYQSDPPSFQTSSLQRKHPIVLLDAIKRLDVGVAISDIHLALERRDVAELRIKTASLDRKHLRGGLGHSHYLDSTVAAEVVVVKLARVAKMGISASLAYGSLVQSIDARSSW